MTAPLANSSSSFDDDTEVFHPTPYQVAAVIYIVITILIIITILFEIIKDEIIESSDRFIRPITKTIFSEMTLFGFLSLLGVFFILTGFAHEWSVEVFGPNASMYIETRLVDVQYSMVLVLVLIFAQVFILVRTGSGYTEKFKEFDEISKSKERLLPYMEEIEHIPHVTYLSWLGDYLRNPWVAWQVHSNREEVEEVATLSPITWLTALLLVVALYGIVVAVGDDYLILAGIWVVLGYTAMFLMSWFEMQVNEVLEHLMNPGHIHELAEGGSDIGNDANSTTNDVGYGDVDGLSSDTNEDRSTTTLQTNSVTLTVSTASTQIDTARIPILATGSNDLSQWGNSSKLPMKKMPIGVSEAMPLRDYSLTSADIADLFDTAHMEDMMRPSGIPGTLTRARDEIGFGFDTAFPEVSSSKSSVALEANPLLKSKFRSKYLMPSPAETAIDSQIHSDAQSERQRQRQSGKGVDRSKSDADDDAGAEQNEKKVVHTKEQDAARNSGKKRRNLTRRRKRAAGAASDSPQASSADHPLRRKLNSESHGDGEHRPSMYPDWHEVLEKLDRRESGAVGDETDEEYNDCLTSLAVYFGDTPPNIQERLFIGGKYGPALNIFVVRFHVVFQALYLAVVVVFFIPYVAEDYGWEWGLLYALLALLPLPVQYLGFYSRMIVQMVMISSCGALIDPHVVVEVLRAQKLLKVIRIMILLSKVQQAGRRAGDGHGHGHKRGVEIDPALQMEMDEVSRIFDLYDKNGDGELDIVELKPLISSLGISVDETGLQKLFVVLDSDGSGTITKDELLAWRMNRFYEGDAQEEAHKIFALFLQEGSVNPHEINVEHFRDMLLSFNEKPYDAKLTPEDIDYMVSTFDPDGDGSITLEEFESALREAKDLEH